MSTSLPMRRRRTWSRCRSTAALQTCCGTERSTRLSAWRRPRKRGSRRWSRTLGAGISWLRATGVYPINHTLVVRNEHLEANPWLAGELFRLFKQAKERFCRRSRRPQTWRTRTHAPGRCERSWVDPLPYGVEANRASLETFIGFTVDQRIIPEAVRPGGRIRAEHA